MASVQSLSPSHNQVMVPVNMGHCSACSEYHNHKWTGAFAANLAAQARGTHMLYNNSVTHVQNENKIHYTHG